MHPYRLLPAFTFICVFLFTFTPDLNAQSFGMESGSIRQPVNRPAGTAKFQICDLVPGQMYSAVLTGLPAGIAPKWLTNNNDPASKTGGLLHFRATSACEEIACVLNSPVAGYLSVWADQNKSRANARGTSSVLEVMYTSSPTDLIANALFGNTCNAISNVTFYGQPGAIGTFSNGQSNIGISEGIVLATGDISVLPGPNDVSNATGGYGFAVAPDSNLATITQGMQFDLCRIEFDITPSGNNLNFQFVFGSEEYCEYVGTQFNDAFGVFISGPGINGVQNLARVPGTNVPVSVNTVNFFTNSNDYINNNNFPSCEGFPAYAPNECQLDGWTNVLPGFISVTPCATYHVKIVIADVGDGVWDSALFLRAFSSQVTALVKPSVEYPNNQTAVYEGCQTGYIRLQRTGTNTSLPVPVSFTVSGTATPGIDYAPLFSPVVIPAGQTEILLPVTPLADALPEGNETIVLEIANACDCDPTLSFTIGEPPPIAVNVPDINYCGPTLLPSTVNGGVPPFSYQWSNGATQAAPVVNASGAYTVTVTDQCGSTQIDQALVTLYTPLPAAMFVPFCAGDTVEVFGHVFTDSDSFFYFEPGQNGQCDTSVNVIVQVVTEYPKSQTISLCPGQPVVLGGDTYFAPGTVKLTASGQNGACDTVTTYFLQLAGAVSLSETRSFCQGSSVTVNGTVYTSDTTVLVNIPGSGSACDTVITYSIHAIPPTPAYDSLFLCPGEVFTFGGQDYTAPAAIPETLSGQNGQCDTLLTHLLLLKTPAPSAPSIACPQQVITTIEIGTVPPPVVFAAATATTNCPCPGMTVDQTGGLPSGSVFALGTTTNCFTAKDACGNTVSCCFQVRVEEEPPCDVKTNGCIKWETISVKEDAQGRKTFKIRVTNLCTAPLISADFQLPKGVVADLPASNSVYTAPSGREYVVTNPNYSPFYSIRFQPAQSGIANGASDIFEYTLPPQADIVYVLSSVRLFRSVYYYAHLTTFNCSDSRAADDRRAGSESGVQLFPNPTDDVLYAYIPGEAGSIVPLRVLDSKGVAVLNTTIVIGAGPQPVPLPDNLPDGIYVLEVVRPDGKTEAQKFVVLRR